MKDQVVLDSSVWIEIFRNGPLVNQCQKELQSNKVVGIPTVVLFEIYKKIAIAVSEEEALSAVAYLKSFPVLDLTVEVALMAGDLAIQHKLSMADSLVLAHAYLLEASLVTLDNDFAGIEDVEIVRRR